MWKHMETEQEMRRLESQSIQTVLGLGPMGEKSIEASSQSLITVEKEFTNNDSGVLPTINGLDIAEALIKVTEKFLEKLHEEENKLIKTQRQKIKKLNVVKRLFYLLLGIGVPYRLVVLKAEIVNAYVLLSELIEIADRIHDEVWLYTNVLELLRQKTMLDEISNLVNPLWTQMPKLEIYQLGKKTLKDVKRIQKRETNMTLEATEKIQWGEPYLIGMVASIPIDRVIDEDVVEQIVPTLHLWRQVEECYQHATVKEPR